MAMERRGRQATAPATEEAVTLHLDSELPHIRRAPGGLVLGGSSVPTRNTRIEEVRCLSVQMSFILSARSVPLIRTSVRRIADAWGFDALLIDDVELIASELSANVVLHSDAAGCTCFDVRLAPLPLRAEDRSLGRKPAAAQRRTVQVDLGARPWALPGRGGVPALGRRGRRQRQGRLGRSRS